MGNMRHEKKREKWQLRYLIACTIDVVGAWLIFLAVQLFDRGSDGDLCCLVNQMLLCVEDVVCSVLAHFLWNVEIAIQDPTCQQQLRC